MANGLGWHEEFLNGSAAAEAALYERFKREINQLQEFAATKGGVPIRRGFHAKTIAGIPNATFVVNETVPPPLAVGFFQPNRSYRAVVRFSNSVSEIKPDLSRQGRGIAIRLYSEDLFHDLLLSNSPASHAKDAIHFMAVASALTNASRLRFIIQLVRSVGLLHAVRMLIVLFRTSGNISSVATETYWTRTAYAFGKLAARLVLKPANSPLQKAQEFPDDLHAELRSRLMKGAVEFNLFAQLFVDDSHTPIEDGSVRWDEAIAPPIPLGQLRLPVQDLSSPAAVEFVNEVEAFAFNPWNVQGDIRPLGSLNRARRVVYEASAAKRCV